MNNEGRPPLLLSLLAALTPFAGAPLLFASGAVLAHGHGHELTEAFQEGGSAMWLVLVAGGLLSVAAAVLLFFGTYRPGPTALAALPLSLVTTALGLWGTASGISGALNAVAMANPDDRAVIMCAGVAEATQASVLGFLATGALLLACSLGFFLGALARARAEAPLHGRMMAFAGLGALACGVWCLSACGQLNAVSTAYKALARVAPADRMVVFAQAAAEGATLSRISLGLGALALITFLLGAALLGKAPVPSVGLGVLGVVTLGGAAGLLALCGAARESAAPAFSVRPPGLLVMAAGDAAEVPPLVLARGEVRWRGAALDEGALGERIEEIKERGHPSTRWDADGSPEPTGLPNKVVMVGLGADADTATLQRLLTALAQREVRHVMLVGQRRLPPPPVALRREFDQVLKAFDTVPVEARFSMGSEQELCPKGCAFATLTERGLHLANDEWPHRAMELGHRTEPAATVSVRLLPSLSPQLLAKGAVTALTHGAALTLVF